MSRSAPFLVTPAMLAGAFLSACSPTESEAPPSGSAHEAAAAHAVSPPVMLLRDVAAGPRWAAPRRAIARPRAVGASTSQVRSGGLAVDAAPLASPAAAVPAPIATFDGLGDGFPLFSVQSAPPDPVGDVGPNHYVQMVNAAFAIFDKAGTRLAGATSTNALFAALGTTHKCTTTNQGDGIVLYDPLADRWFLTQFAFDLDPTNTFPVAPFFQCVALSRTPDPTGQYDVYAFGPYTFGGAPAMNDYPKFGVWPDAYYMTANMFTPDAAANFLGAKVCGFDRAKMLSPNPTVRDQVTQQCFEIPGNGGLLPADLDGARPPPSLSPGYVMSFDIVATGSILQLWRVRLDWANSAASALEGAITIPVANITLACDGLAPDPINNPNTCIPQPGTTTQLDALGDRLMHRLAYRNFGDHESLLATHTVRTGAPARAGPRWYELRNAPGQTLASADPVLATNLTGTHSPDATFRWMGSAAQDQLGDIAIGYSTSSATLHPSLAYVARAWNEPAAGAMSFTEGALFTGAGSQTTFVSPPGTQAQALTRWGDYSALTVDPADDCTFWYTNEYLLADGAFNWHTRVGRFRLPACPPQYAVSLPATVSSGTAAAVTITAQDALASTWTSYAGPASLSSDDAGATFSPGASASFASGVATVAITFSTPGSHTLTVADPFSPNLRKTVTITVAGAAGIVGFQVTIAGAGTAGAAQAFSALAIDAQGATVASYAGTATLSSSDPGATFTPATLTFTAGAAGGSVLFVKAGAQTVSLADQAAPALRGSASISVAPAAIASFAIAGLPASLAAGTAVSFTVTARDPFGNLGFGTAALTSSDGAATIAPMSLTFAGDVPGATVTFGTAGAQSITVQDGITASVTVDVTAAPAPTPTPTPIATPTPTPSPTASSSPAKGGCSSASGGVDLWVALGLAIAIAHRARRKRAHGSEAEPRRSPSVPTCAALLALGALATSGCAEPAPRAAERADAALNDAGQGAEAQTAEHAVSPPVNELPDAPAPPRADHRPGPIRRDQPDAGAAVDAGS